MSRFPVLLALTFFLTPFASATAEPGDPVAVRWWGQAMVSIETFDGLTVVIDPYGEKIGYANPHVSGDLVLITHEHGDHNNAALVEGEPVVERGLDESGAARTFTMVLDRFPGSEKTKWYDAKLRMARSPNAIQVTSIPAWHDDTEGSERGANAMFIIDVDGQRIVHCGDLGQPKLTDEQLKMMINVDVLLIPVGGVYTVDGQQAVDIVRQVKPRIVVPIHYKTPNLVYDLQGVQGFLEAIGDDAEVERVAGNTLAVSVMKRSFIKPHVVLLDFQPWEMPAEMTELFAAKEKACQASQAVFEKLSAAQMNFKPGDGTHTPRWNAEHMLGRELGFFSQIYHDQLPSVMRHIDLNPKQMPPDYVAAHPDWSGAAEARQMERVSAYTRRFAYLMKDLPLDEPAPGSRWTPRKLLMQMARHYNEHTANVKKKFELPGWPVE